MKPLERRGLFDLWDDTRIKPGAIWRREIEQALAAAQVAILLISADFLASDFIDTKELPPLLAAAEATGCRILPIIVSPSLFADTELSQFQTVNSPDKPLIDMNHAAQEKVFLTVAQAIRNLLGESKV